MQDSRVLAENLGIRFLEISITEAFQVFKASSGNFPRPSRKDTEENIQPRLRGLTLMALSNKFGHLVAQHWQQERTGRGLLHPVRRYGGWSRCDQRCAQDNHLRTGPLD